MYQYTFNNFFFFCFSGDHGSSVVKPVPVACASHVPQNKKWKRFTLQYNLMKWKRQLRKRGDMRLGIYQDVCPLVLTAGVLFGPLHFLQVENCPCSWIITHDTKQFGAQIRIGFNTFLLLLKKFIQVLYS